MNRFTFIIKSFKYYQKANILIALGVAISAAVITGGLIIGDSVTHSLEQITSYRLGSTSHVITSADRYFSQQVVTEMSNSLEVAPVLISEGVVVSGGGEYRANRVQVLGIDPSFAKISGTGLYSGLAKNEIVISESLAEKMKVKVGDNILVRIKKASLIPQNAPFVSGEETTVSYRANIKAIAGKKDLGRFSLKNSQTAPYNLFLPLDRINELMGFEGKANRLLINSLLSGKELLGLFKQAWKPVDANLLARHIQQTGETEVYSERVFLEDAISNKLLGVHGANGILTYFVNSLANTQDNGLGAPYSFVSTLPDSVLQANEVIINQWLADDLKAKKGAFLQLAYFTIGPLRQLKIDSAVFQVKEVIPMQGKFGDPTLMPFLPGMSDAGDCDEWEAGIPIDLEKIRDKDEAYWDKFKGTPKAFIARSKALELWANRFGNYTAVRFNAQDFDAQKLDLFFKDHIMPESLGFYVDAVKENGLKAAQNGVDFSQLFIGLSFFILVAAIMLASLLYLLHLENRYPQIGTLSTLGYKHQKIKNLFLVEGVMIALVGSLLGLVLAVFYTKMVFRALNTLWFDIVRTNVLEIFIAPETLLVGFVISGLLSVLVISLTINKKLKQQTSAIQKKIKLQEKQWLKRLKIGLAILFLMVPVGIVFWQFLQDDSQNPGLFFMAGGLMLFSWLLFF